MKIKSISINAGRTLSMPGTAYANVRPQVTFTAELEKGEDAIEAAKTLHRQAEEFMEDVCDELLAFAASRSMSRERHIKRELADQPNGKTPVIS